MQKNKPALKSNLTDLGEVLARHMAADGPMSVSEFMAEALGHPKYGYYMKQDPFGAGGDFITAPEISQMFGEMLAVWVMNQWQTMGRPHEFALVELGPGRGTLMADMIRTMAMLMPNIIEALSFQLVETSPALRAMQTDALKEYGVPIFHDSIDSLPDTAPLFVIANEFFDALPIHQFQKVNETWFERCIGFDEDSQEFIFILDATPVPDGLCQRFPKANTGDIFETCPAAVSITDALGKRIKAQTGALIAIDYGHLKAGVGDTFQALRAHEYTSPLIDIGDADLTAHVDFEALANVIKNVGQVELTNQARFLKPLGIEIRAETLMNTATSDQKENVKSALDRLIGADQMGELFKVMTLTSKP